MTRRTVTRTLTAAAAGYLLGTLPSADIAAALASSGTVDLRSTGSGNPGATNAANVLGKQWGAIVLAADVAKSAAACGAGRVIGGDAGGYAAGAASVLGHCFPVWSGFRGGKGVASAAGQCLATFPVYLPYGAGIAGSMVLVPWQDRSFRAISFALAGAVVTGAVAWRRGWSNGWGPRPTVALPLAAATTTAVVVSRFRAERARTRSTEDG